MSDIPEQGCDKIEEELLQKLIGAPEADLGVFEQLIQQHQKRIVADCRYMTRDENSAEDLAQEIFLKAYFGLRSFEGRSSFRHWLQRIKVHHCLNHIKRQEGRKQISLDDENTGHWEQLQVPPAAQNDFETIGNRQQIGRVLESLPSTLRIPLIMRDMDKLSYEEIATSLGVGLSAIKMRIKRAREEFRFRYTKIVNTPGSQKIDYA